MTCDDVTPALLAWQLGACEGPEREAIDAHLAACPACVARALATKRVTEDAAAFDERPSLPVRERLRATVAKRAQRRPVAVRWVVGLAAAALIIALVGWRMLAPPSLSTPASAAGHGLVDADGPANLDVL
jgi:anti-sigma factor RsiW